MQKSKICWLRNSEGKLGWSSNPVKGICPMHCKLSNGYEYCYASGERGLYKRYKWDPTIRFDIEELTEWGKAKPGDMVFVGSTIDLFHKDTMEATQWIISHTRHYLDVIFVFLTKQPQNLAQFKWQGNCWVGATATNLVTFDLATHFLARVDAKVKFLSIEPLLGRIGYEGLPYADEVLHEGHIDWVIIVQLTGTQAKKYKPESKWVEEIIKAADEASIPVWTKDNLNWTPARREKPMRTAKERHEV